MEAADQGLSQKFNTRCSWSPEHAHIEYGLALRSLRSDAISIDHTACAANHQADHKGGTPLSDQEPWLAGVRSWASDAQGILENVVEGTPEAFFLIGVSVLDLVKIA
jgi:hypothetical protein